MSVPILVPCRSCNTDKPITEFHRQSKSPSGYRQPCKECRSEKGDLKRKERNAAYAYEYIPHPLSPERRREIAKLASQTRHTNSTPEERQEFARQAGRAAAERYTHEQRSEQHRQGWVTRRRKQSQS